MMSERERFEAGVLSRETGWYRDLAPDDRRRAVAEVDTRIERVQAELAALLVQREVLLGGVDGD